jgi:hypothetical protein
MGRYGQAGGHHQLLWTVGLHDHAAIWQIFLDLE